MKSSMFNVKKVQVVKLRKIPNMCLILERMHKKKKERLNKKRKKKVWKVVKRKENKWTGKWVEGEN